MQEMKNNTESHHLDNLIKNLFDYRKSNKYKQLIDLISRKDISREDLTQVIPNNLLFLFYTLLNDKLFESILKKTNIELHPKIESARKLINDDFTQLIEHPLFPKLKNEIESAIMDAETEEEDPHIEKFNIPETISFFPILNGFPPRLIPAVRIALIDLHNKVLFESMLQLDDLTFLINGFLGILEEDLVSNKKLMDIENIYITESKKKRIRENIDNANKKISNINEILNSYNI